MKNKHQLREYFNKNMAVGAFGGMLFYIGFCLHYGGLLIGPTIICLLLGAIGGIFPDVLTNQFGPSLTWIRSWLMIGILLIAVPLSGGFIFPEAFVYGYLCSLLWTARSQKLPDY